jgi:hypothetical protein
MRWENETHHPDYTSRQRWVAPRSVAYNYSEGVA